MSSCKHSCDDLSTILEQDKAQEPSHAPTQIEDLDDISTYVHCEAANGAPLLIRPSANVIIIRDKDHDVPDDVFSDPKNGVPLQLPPALNDKEYSIQELFGEEEASSGNSLGSETTILDPLTQQPALQAGNKARSEDPVLSADSGNNSQLGDDNSPDINLQGIEWISTGLEYLATVDDSLGALIRENQIVPGKNHDTQKMTNFQKVTRSLLELFSIPQRKSTIYEALEQLCHPDIVRPHSVGAASDQDLISIGVSSRSKAMTISEMGKKFAEAAGDDRNALLSDASLNDMSDEEIYNQLQGVRGLGAYIAYTIMIFGLEKMLNSWPIEKEFRLKYYKFNQQFRRWPWSHEAVAAWKSWEPFRGLAAWIIWTHL